MLALTLALLAAPQAPLAPDRAPSAVRHAGTYHVATGTWTRTGGAAAAFGPDVVYDNTAASGYFTGTGSAGQSFAGAHITDDGGIPGPSNLDHSHPGIVDSYVIDGFEIGYCDMGPPGTGGFRLRFYEEFHACTTPTRPPVATLDLNGLPAGGGCWTVTVDLAGTTDEFCLYADGGFYGGGWANDPDLDAFSWSYEHLSPSTSGFLIAGDPGETESNFVPSTPIERARDGTGTFFGPASLCAVPGQTRGTGYLTRDIFYLPGYGCAFFGGYRNRNGCGGPQSNPYASFHMKLYTTSGQVCDRLSIGTEYCVGVANSTGSAGNLDVFGSTLASLDSVTLIASQLPPSAFGVFITSTSQGFVQNPGGSLGDLCVVGNIGRFVAPGQIKAASAGGQIQLSTLLGEWSLSAIPTSMGPYAATAGLTSNFQLWHRDAVGGQAVSNFTSAESVTWL